jgi:hypothetical protein
LAFLIVEGVVPSGVRVQIPLTASSTWQYFVLAFFFISGLIGGSLSLVLLFKAIRRKKWREAAAYTPGILALFGFAFMLYRIVLFTDDIIYTNIDEVIRMLKIISWILATLGPLFLLSAVYQWIVKRNLFIRILYTVWSLSFLLFISWLYQVNLIG